jgi:pilus assembly protein CpaF
MCTIHADSSSGVFRRLASYAVQSPERLPVEATNLLVAGSVHFVVFIDIHRSGSIGVDRVQDENGSFQPPKSARTFHPIRRTRFVSSVREVIDADGMQVISNEVFKPGADRRAVPASPLRSETLDELMEYGYEPAFGGEPSW